MSDRIDHVIIDDNSCPSLDQLVKYKESMLDSQESHKVEKHLLSCSICNEVIDHLHIDNLVEMTAVAASIDQRVAERISPQSGSGSNNLNFNGSMAIAAIFVGFLMLVGNLFFNDDTSTDPEEPMSAVEQMDEEVQKDKEHTEVSVAEYKEEDQPEEEVTTIDPDPVYIINDLDTSVEDVVNVSETDKAESDVVVSTPEKVDSNAGNIKPVQTPRYLMAFIDVIIIAQTGESLSNKGSTDKKVKLKSNQGYAPEIEADEGYPLYPGGEKQLKKDIVKRINNLQLTLGQGGQAEIIFAVTANGTIGAIKVDEKVSVGLANQLRGAIRKLQSWIPGNVEIQYTVKVVLQ